MKERRPGPYSTDPKLLAREVEVHTFRASGPGGQKRNKTDSAVRIRHIPSGIMAVATESRSQSRNRQKALERLIEKLQARNHRPRRRIPTRVPRAVRERTLETKRRRSQKKTLRERVRLDEE